MLPLPAAYLRRNYNVNIWICLEKNYCETSLITYKNQKSAITRKRTDQTGIYYGVENIHTPSLTKGDVDNAKCLSEEHSLNKNKS